MSRKLYFTLMVYVLTTFYIVNFATIIIAPKNSCKDYKGKNVKQFIKIIKELLVVHYTVIDMYFKSINFKQTTLWH